MKLLETSTLEVDYREPADTGSFFLLALGASHCDVKAKRKYGDIAWSTENGSFGVELKSVSDALNSLWNRKTGERLEAQLTGLRQCVDFPILGIHGTLLQNGLTLEILGEPELISNGTRFVRKSYRVSSVADTKYTAASLNGFLWSIRHPDDGGRSVDVIWRPRKEDLLHAVLEVYHWSRKPSHQTFKHVLNTNGAAPRTQRETYIRVLEGIPSIGEGTAKALIDKFGSPFQVALASESDLLLTEGVGKKTVEILRHGLGVK